MRHRNDVGIGIVACGFNRLLAHHVRERGDFVTVQRGLLKLQLLGSSVHFALQFIQHRVRLAAQELHACDHICSVVGFGNQSHTRRGATLNLMQYTRTRAIAKHSLITRAQHKDFLQ